MWFCFKNAFVSAVQHNEKPDILVVRARRRKHLEVLFPHHEIIGMVGSDYKWRCFVDKSHFAELVRRTIMEIDYDNFKNTVKDQDLHEMYMDIWTAGWVMQK
jgi:hypothetical protein